MSQTMVRSSLVLGLALTAVLGISAILVTPSSAQDTNANVNIDNLAPTISVVEKDSSFNGPWANGATLNPVSGSNNTLTVNADVTDENGFDNQTIAVTAVLNRAPSAGTGNFDCAGDEHNCLPRTGDATCTTGDSDPKTRRYTCVIDMPYKSDPTTTGSQVDPSTNYVDDEWWFMIKANDGVVDTIDKNSRFEYAELVSLQLNTSVLDLGTAPADGVTETPDDGGNGLFVPMLNYGNTMINLQLQADKATDDAAWSCVDTLGDPQGPGVNPLISDLHFSVAAADSYGAMSPLTNSGSTLDLETSYARHADGLTGPTQRIGSRFRTAQPIGPGLCTLSAISISAIRDNNL